MNFNRLETMFLAATAVFLCGLNTPAQAALNIAQTPLFSQTTVAPLNMLVMGRDHKLYYEAYNDASDLNGDDVVDIGYKPDDLDYYGYFDSHRCYNYDSASGGVFRPTSITANKRCSGAWSGDFLNYVTTTRIDAMRKVLYGGRRSTDTTSETIIERSAIPKDAHTWGKEYESAAISGYNISDYTPLSAPLAGTRHLFANATLGPPASNPPQMRVMTNSSFRIWNWVSKEAGSDTQAGSTCFNSSNTEVACIPATGSSSPMPALPANRTAFDTLQTTYAVVANRYGTGTMGVSASPTPTTINCTSGGCNPYGVDDQYLTVVSGQIQIRSGQGGTYTFSIDGDDSVDFRITTTAGVLVAEVGRYGSNSACSCDTSATAAVALASATTYNFTFRHVENSGSDSYRLRWKKGTGSFGTVPAYNASSGNGGINNTTVISTFDLTPALPTPVLTDYTVRAQVCRDATLKEANCKQYPNGSYKPTGLLHDYGEDDSMMFGLLSGSFFNNLEGGVLRKNIASFRNEIIANTGQFDTAVNGIVKAMNAFRIAGVSGYSWPDYSYSGSNCTANISAYDSSGAIQNGQCPDWGNPVAEMMYESTRYYAGAAAATPRFATGGSTVGQTYETSLGLTTATWVDPYRTSGGFPTCSKPFQTVISDVNNSYDTGLPGNTFSDTTPNGTTPATLSGFSAGTQGDTIWTQEFGGSRSIFIGQSGATYDSAPTPKTVTTFGNIRGLAPEEPTKKGSYYPASVARYAWLNDVNPATGDQKVKTYAIALASPLPRIVFPVGTNTVTIVPFAKTIGGAFGVTPGATFQPTNQIVDYYVEQLANFPGQPTNAAINGGRPSAIFAINFEDIEQGNDHDMDDIVKYTIQLTAANTVQVGLQSTYAYGGATQYAGYVISGTSADGLYMVVKDLDTGAGTLSANFRLTTPPTRAPGYCNSGSPPAECLTILPATDTRTFTPSAMASTSSVLQPPLWYAAKYGGFRDINGDSIPQGSEWDANNGTTTGGPDGDPDNYFLVTNASGLKDQLSRAFDAILSESRPTGTLTVSGVRVDSGSIAYVPEFKTAEWTGDLYAKELRTNGSLGAEVWSAAAKLPAYGSRNILAITTPGTYTTRQVNNFTVAGLGGAGTATTSIGLTAATLSTAYPGASIDNAIDYLRGDGSREQSVVGGVFRSRAKKIGDIIGSIPVMASNRQNFGWSRFSAVTGSGTYNDYVQNVKSLRTPTIYVGANDGMLHAFDAQGRNASGMAIASGGVELFSVIPSSALPRMGALLSPTYTHQYYVDGKLTIGDAYLGGGWKTVLVGSTGAGGKSVFALNLENPNAFTAAHVMWELSGSDTDLGVSIGKPAIAALPGDRWVAVFGNGYNSTNQDAVLFVVDLTTGALLRKITAAAGDDAAPNGLGNVALKDNNRDGFADTAYGSDYQGRIWKFDLSASAPASWGMAFSGAPLFTALDQSGVAQNITGDLALAAGPNNTTMVYFGTGRYFLVGDNNVPATPQIETFYAVQDNGSPMAGRGALQAQNITIPDPMTGDRRISQNDVDYDAGQRGWYIDLAVSPTTGAPVREGERFFGAPLLTSGQVVFVSFTPVGSECDPGGRNRFYFLDSLSGGRLGDPTTRGSATPTGNPCVSNGTCIVGTTDASLPPMGEPAVAIPPVECNPLLDASCVNPACDPAVDPTCVDPPLTCNPARDPTCTPPGLQRQCRIVFPGTGATPVVLPRPCGRQSWREIGTAQ